MAYRFAGFFASPVLPQPDSLPAGAAWREIDSPFAGIGVRMPALVGKTPARDDMEMLARQLGLDAANRWLYINYDCWGGRIDFVYGFGISSGFPFGPVEEGSLRIVNDAYTRLMAQFGVLAEDALRFAPFRRFWDER